MRMKKVFSLLLSAIMILNLLMVPISVFATGNGFNQESEVQMVELEAELKDGLYQFDLTEAIQKLEKEKEPTYKSFSKNLRLFNNRNNQGIDFNISARIDLKGLNNDKLDFSWDIFENGPLHVRVDWIDQSPGSDKIPQRVDDLLFASKDEVKTLTKHFPTVDSVSDIKITYNVPEIQKAETRAYITYPSGNSSGGVYDLVIQITEIPNPNIEVKTIDKYNEIETPEDFLSNYKASIRGTRASSFTLKDGKFSIKDDKKFSGAFLNRFTGIDDPSQLSLQVSNSEGPLTQGQVVTFDGIDYKVSTNYSYETGGSITLTQEEDDVIPNKNDENEDNPVPGHYVKVEFKADEDKASLDGETVFHVNPNAKNVSIDDPTINPKLGYGVADPKWDPLVQTSYSEETTHNAQLYDIDNVVPGKDEDGKPNAQPEGYVTVTYSPGENGSLEGETTYYVNPQAADVDLPEPSIIPNVGFEVAEDKWKPAKQTQYTEDTEHVAQYEELKDLIPGTDPDTKDPNEKPQGYVTVSFDAGAHGTLDGETIYYVNPNADNVSISEPKVKANKGYEFTKWDPEVKKAYTEDTIHTAQYKDKADELVIIPGDNVEFPKTGYVRISFEEGEFGKLTLKDENDEAQEVDSPLVYYVREDLTWARAKGLVGEGEIAPTTALVIPEIQANDGYKTKDESDKWSPALPGDEAIVGAKDAKRNFTAQYRVDTCPTPQAFAEEFDKAAQEALGSINPNPGLYRYEYDAENRHAKLYSKDTSAGFADVSGTGIVVALEKLVSTTGLQKIQIGSQDEVDVTNITNKGNLKQLLIFQFVSEMGDVSEKVANEYVGKSAAIKVTLQNPDEDCKFPEDNLPTLTYTFKILKDVTVIFDPNGGEIKEGDSKISLVEDDKAKTIPADKTVPTVEKKVIEEVDGEERIVNYNFKGWEVVGVTDENDQALILENADAVKAYKYDKDTSLKAVWEKVEEEELVTLTITKKWLGLNGEPIASAFDTTTNIRPETPTKSLDFPKGEYVKSVELPKLDDQGNPIDYKISEKDSDQDQIDKGGKTYKIEYAGDMRSGFTVTYTLQNETFDLKVEKVWKDSANNEIDPPEGAEVKVDLLKNGELIKSGISLDENGETTFEGLNKFNEEKTGVDGVLNQYSVVEVGAENGSIEYDGKTYTVSYEPNAYEHGKGLNINPLIRIVNKEVEPEQEFKDLTISKEWIGLDEKAFENPKAVGFDIYELDENEKPLAEPYLNVWIHEGVPTASVKVPADKDFTVKEVGAYEADGKTFIDLDGHKYQVTSEDNEGNWTFTNTLQNETFDLEVNKVWKNKAGEELSENTSTAKIKLVTNGQESDEVKELTNDTFTFENLARYNPQASSGLQLVENSYTVKEVGVDGKYQVTQTRLEDTIKLTNSETPDEAGELTLTIKKTWKGLDDKEFTGIDHSVFEVLKGKRSSLKLPYLQEKVQKKLPCLRTK